MSKSIGNQTLQSISDDVARRLQERGVHDEGRRAAKVLSAKIWWLVAAALFAVALLFVAAGFYIAATKEMTVALAVLIGTFIVVPFLGALFAANTASGEATQAFIRAAASLGRAGRRAVKGKD